ncbi:hypothetical protein U0070_024518 [Myodes glareolus]|uniref:Uncharacterized protein n=1 Tax=Myodes glareolus TaxID=447135 RepID=A0AAW0HLU0_MYOGA
MCPPMTRRPMNIS